MLLRLSENLFNDSAVNVGEPAIDSVVIESQFFMVEAQQMQNRGVKVGNDDFVIADEVADFI